jgi:hypothetical protein
LSLGLGPFLDLMTVCPPNRLVGDLLRRRLPASPRHTCRSCLPPRRPPRRQLAALFRSATAAGGGARSKPGVVFVRGRRFAPRDLGAKRCLHPLTFSLAPVGG